MLLSALLTSVGINLGLCLLFFTLYSILRKQPGNLYVYAPRLVDKEKSRQQESGDFDLERLLPSAGWVRNAWQLSEDEILSVSGLDGLVFTRIFTFSLRVFTIAGVIGIFILLPVNYFGNQLSDDFDHLPNKSLDSFSISNVNDGSNRLWVHFSAAYIFTGVVCYLLYNEHNYMSAKRIACFYSSKPQPHQFTILWFIETSKIQNLINDADKLYRKLGWMKSNNHSQQKFRRDGFLGLTGRKVSLSDHYEKKLEDLEDNVRDGAEFIGWRGAWHQFLEVPAAFVSFKSRLGAAVALHIQQGVNPTEWVTEQAPEPRDVHWAFFSASFIKRWIFKLVVPVACFALIVLYLIPVVIVQGLANLDQLETWFPFLKGILSLTVVSQVITGYLPSLILQLFMFFVPPIMLTFSAIQGYISRSQIERSACSKMLWFIIWNVFFANVLSGSALYEVNVFLEPKNIPRVLAEAVPGQASFFISYVVTSGWTKLSSELFRLTPLVCSFWKRLFSRKDGNEFEVPSLPYYNDIPTILFFGLLGITYFFLAPLILPFLLVYFCLGYIIFRNQLLNVYAPKYETNGKFWPIVHNSTVFSLILMHIIAFGIFGLKKLPLASTLLIPLPVLTLIFNAYCQNRFLPLFKAYPTECLVKQDRKEQNEAGMTEFYDKLVTAYQDPALMPVQYARSTDRDTSPLLHSTEV
ncbi:CSC1-LIKE PROTEIN HYP1 [Salix viminalis]|uniref:CSC1-LIKE PROTEIN HYP1 n=1 Tax=Salix viminalis TaxID=40686 RepID=A0A9Q0QIU6_SALVM|nr:CSC1-LIKE PROTEIN HYP1 [Salix viminalis]